MWFEKMQKFWNNGLHRFRRTKNQRLYMLAVFFLLLFGILIHRLWVLQIANGRKYADEFELKTTKTVRQSAIRGNIYDRNGKVLAYNRLVYTLTITDEGKYTTVREKQLTLNSAMYHLAKTMKENGENILHDLKISLGEAGHYQYTVSGTALKRFKADVFGKATVEEMTKEEESISADDMIAFLSSEKRFALHGTGETAYTKEECRKYGIPAQYTSEEVLWILGIRYMLSLNAYRKYVPVTVARDITEKTMAFVEENKEQLPGVEIGQEWERVYEGGEAFSHILGYVGGISSEELEQYKKTDKKYTADSVVGKTGLEKYLENELQGTDGETQITVNNVGKVLGEGKINKETVNGKNVTLSLDKELQTAVYQMLEQALAGILVSNLINEKTFDKSQISDTTDIRIPVYDIYIALFENHVLRADSLSQPEGELEKRMAEAWEQKQKEVQKKIKKELSEGTAYKKLPEEMKDYADYIVEESGILDENTVYKEDEIYKIWKKDGDYSLKRFLMYALEKGWIKEEAVTGEKGYFTSGEMYERLTEELINNLANSQEFKMRILRYTILEDRISGTDICLLLYRQGVLSKKDEDYRKLMTGEMDAFSFVKKKIVSLELTPAMLAQDPCSASAVVVKPESGEVLACVSYPGYDNNRLTNAMDTDYYNQLLSDRSLPLYNRATKQLTAPGSTLKPVTIVAGLQEGVISSDTAVRCDGVFDKVSPPLRCWKHSGHGNVANAPMALQFSCNDYLCEISYRLGMKVGEYDDSRALQSLQKYARLFRLDELSGIETEESKPHITDAYGIPSAIGQGTHNYTLTQIARYVNTIASGGNAAKLSLLKSETEEKSAGDNQEQIRLPEETWKTVWSGMMQFAQNNDLLKKEKTECAGKTGTAQEAADRPDHALFIGYAPAKKPEISVAVRIANGYGSSNATLVGRNIFRYYFGTEKKENIVTGKADNVENMSTD